MLTSIIKRIHLHPPLPPTCHYKKKNKSTKLIFKDLSKNSKTKKKREEVIENMGRLTKTQGQNK